MKTFITSLILLISISSCNKSEIISYNNTPKVDVAISIIPNNTNGSWTYKVQAKGVKENVPSVGQLYRD